MISVTLTYYITYYDDLYNKKVETNNSETNEICQQNNSILNHVYIKIILAFFAGGIVSDRLFLKLSVF